MSITKKAVTSLTLDLSMPNVQTGFTCTLGDRARRLEILVTDGGRPYDIPPTWSAFLSGVKPDQTELVNGCVVENGRLTYDFESGEQIATCAGRFAVTVWIMDEEGTPVASPKIWVNVIDSGVQAIMNNNSSEDQFGVLQEIVGNINALIEKDAQVDEELETMWAKLKNVVSSSVITIDPSQWTDVSPHEATINIGVPVGTERRSTVLLIPKNKETRDESQAIELTVKTLWTADQAMEIMITMTRQDTDPPTIPLSYLALVIYDEEAANDSKATAEFVGVVNLPDELMEREVKRALEVLGVTEDLIKTMGDVDAVRKDVGQAKNDIDQAKNDIDQAKTDIEKMVSVESVTVSKIRWTGIKRVQVVLSGADDPDTVFFFFPADEQTKTAATKARMTILTLVPSLPSHGILSVTLNVEDESFVKETDLTFTVLRVREEGATERRAVLVGVDSYGDIIPAVIDLSRLDDGEVVETFSDGTTKTTTIEYDADGNPVKITDGDGNETVLTW